MSGPYESKPIIVAPTAAIGHSGLGSGRLGHAPVDLQNHGLAVEPLFGVELTRLEFATPADYVMAITFHEEIALCVMNLTRQLWFSRGPPGSGECACTRYSR